MNKLSRTQKFLAIAVFLLSIFLRFHNYAVYPQRGATSDEYTYSFLGVSLLTQGVPISWSAFPEYPNRKDLRIDGIHFPLVWPYFDHPPLYALVTGSFLLLFGQNTFAEITLQTLRILPIILATVASLFVFFLAKKLYGFHAAIFSFLLYTTTTIFVMNQRISFAENLLTVLFLGSLYVFLLVQKKLQTKYIIFLGILAGLAFLTKIMGIAVFLSILLLLFIHGVKRKSVGLFALSFTLCSSLLLLYAAFFGWDTFWAIQAAQSARNIGPQALFMLAMQPVIVNKIYYDGWYFLGLLALLVLSFDFRKHAIIVIPSLVYFFLLLTSLTREGQSGWYMIPLFPFMAIATSIFVLDTLKQKSLTFFLVPLFIGLYFVQYIFEPVFGLSPSAYRVFLGLLFLPLFFAFVYKKGKFFRRAGTVVFYLFLLGSIYLTYNYVHPG